jgi:hydrophobe/amphiphile efflux-1 (HAE1) family protein/NodT family efflux transporter outer membrane factor (OMF) lipoprotein
MNISAPFIKRSVGTALLTAAIALAGAVAYLQLPVAPLPQVDFPTISIGASLPGASPEIMASSVAAPLERQLGHIAGVNEMTSSSTLGSTSITLQFDLNRDINGAARDVQAAINAARANLPANLPSNPSYRKVNPADAPIMILALTSDIYARGQLYDAASTIIQQKLLQIQGVGQVNIGGGALPAVRVEVNPTLLNSFGLSLQDVSTMLGQQNANLAKGQLADGNTTADILANDQLLKAAGYENLVVAYRNGAAIRLSDIANVQDGVENIRTAGFLNGKPSIPLIILREPGANIIETVDRIKAALPSLKASMPAAINMDVVLDRTTTIRASVREIERTLLISVALVILVVFIFLRSPRATLIPAVVVPVSLIATFGVMYLFGYSVDNLSLMALTISTGFVVDDAIVVIENISRHLEKGMSATEAALIGAREVGFTVLSISVSLVVVFIPILLMGGIVGRLFREFAVVLSTAILVSLVVSLTATPMMCSRLLRHRKPEEHGKIYRASEKIFAKLLGAYERSLTVVLRHPAITLVILLLTIVVNIFLFVIVPKGFFPQQDNGTIQGGIQGAQDISFSAMQSATLRFDNLIKSDPAVANVIAFTGGGGAANGGFIFLALKPLEERKIRADQIIARLRPKLASVPGVSVFLQAGQDLRIGGRMSSAQYQYTIQSENLDDLIKWGPILLQQMKILHGFTEVNTDQQNQGLQASLVYDRATAARLGISPQTIDQTLYDAFGQAQVSTMFTSLNQYHVVMEAAPQFWHGPQGLNDIYLRATNSSAVVPLNAIAHYEPTTAPIAVNHQGQFPAVTLSFNLTPGVSLSDAVKSIQQMEQKIKMPETIHGSFSGTLQAFQESLANEKYLILAALVAVYIVLGILYESYIHPITILSTLPSAGVGAVLALMIFKTDLSIIAVIGILLLIGIVKKNAIMMVDFALAAEREQEKNSRDAIFQACLLRFRPILMTTMSAICGALPLILSSGTGSELRRPLGITIVGGLIMSQALTLFTTPVVYLYLDRMRLWWERNHKKKTEPGMALQPAAIVTMLGFILFASGCSFAPHYAKPSIQTPTAFKELTSAQTKTTDGWKIAEPKDDALRGKWWKMFGDTNLNALEDQADVSNQTVAAALENFLSARAVVKQTRSEFFPTVSADPSVTRSRQSSLTRGQTIFSTNNNTVIFNDYSLPLDASWEPDFWGSIRNAYKANKLEAQATLADLENTRLTIHSELAADYFTLRSLDAQKQLFDSTVRSYQDSLQLTHVLYKTGIDSDQDVAQAETQLETTEAQATDLGIQRAQMEHAIALLIGQPASLFSVTTNSLVAKPVAIPFGVPAQLLERRPDVAAAERRVAEANAQIGVARAAYFPTVTLSGSVGYESSSTANLFSGPAFIWSIGGTLAQTIFDAGRRQAVTEQAWASYRGTVANYRETVLAAFQEVEDNLASLRILSQELQQQDAAVASSQRYLNLAVARYKLGVDSYLNIITAQTTLLSNQRTALNLRLEQMTASVQLINALGGGWEVGQPFLNNIK